MTNPHVQRISDAIAMMVRHQPATLSKFACEIPGFVELHPDKAWEWSLNGFRLGAYISESGADGLLHALNNRRAAIKFCNRSDDGHRDALFSYPTWVAVEFARPQSANFRSDHGPQIFHVRPEFIDLLYEVEPGARYLKIAGPTHVGRRSGRG